MATRPSAEKQPQYACRGCGSADSMFEEGEVRYRATRGVSFWVDDDDGDKVHVEEDNLDLEDSGHGDDFDGDAIYGCANHKCPLHDKTFTRKTLSDLIVRRRTTGGEFVDPLYCECGHHKSEHYAFGSHNWTCSLPGCECLDYEVNFGVEVADGQLGLDVAA